MDFQKHGTALEEPAFIVDLSEVPDGPLGNRFVCRLYYLIIIDQ